MFSPTALVLAMAAIALVEALVEEEEEEEEASSKMKLFANRGNKGIAKCTTYIH